MKGLFKLVPFKLSNSKTAGEFEAFNNISICLIPKFDQPELPPSGVLGCIFMVLAVLIKKSS